MKNFLSFIWIFILAGGCNSLQVCEFVSISDLVNKGIEEKKPSLIYFYSSDCIVCELFELKVLENKDVIRYINDHFILYKIDITKNKEFNKILYAYGMPWFCVVEGDEFKNILHASTNVDLFLFSLSNYRSVPFHSTLTGITNLKGEPVEMAKAMNGLLGLNIRMVDGTLSSDSIRLCLEKNVETFPYFYNQYLLAQSYQGIDSVKVMTISKDLIDHLTGLEEMIYGDELKILYRSYYKLKTGDKGDVKFEHINYDFGKVKPAEKAVHYFPFVNNGNHPLLIYSVNTTCGCTTPYWTRHPILSGEIDSIRVELLGSVPGKIQKSVHVVTNSEKSVTTLTITADIE